MKRLISLSLIVLFSNSLFAIHYNNVLLSAFNTENKEFEEKEQGDVELHYFKARYYNANIGRFLSPDPHTLNPRNLNLADPQNLNPYVYGRNNPLSYYDPNGEYYIDVFTRQIVNEQEVYQGVTSVMHAVLAGEHPHMSYVKGGGPTEYDVIQYGQRTKVAADNPIYAKKGLEYREVCFFEYRAYARRSEYTGSLMLDRIPQIKVEPPSSVEVIGKEYKTGKNVFNVSFGGEIFNEEGTKMDAFIRFELKGTFDQINNYLNDRGYELYREKDSWLIRGME